MLQIFFLIVPAFRVLAGDYHPRLHPRRPGGLGRHRHLQEGRRPRQTRGVFEPTQDCQVPRPAAGVDRRHPPASGPAADPAATTASAADPAAADPNLGGRRTDRPSDQAPGLAGCQSPNLADRLARDLARSEAAASRSRRTRLRQRVRRSSPGQRG